VKRHYGTWLIAAVFVAVVTLTSAAVPSTVHARQVRADVSRQSPYCDENWCHAHFFIKGSESTATLIFEFDLKVARHGPQVLWGEHWAAYGGDSVGAGDSHWNNDALYRMDANSSHSVLHAYARATFHYTVGPLAGRNWLEALSCTLWSRGRQPQATCKDGTTAP